MPRFEVVVSNIGQVYMGDDDAIAHGEYAAWVDLSQAIYGRARGESVTLFMDGEIVAEYVGELHREGE